MFRSTLLRIMRENAEARRNTPVPPWEQEGGDPDQLGWREANYGYPDPFPPPRHDPSQTSVSNEPRILHLNIPPSSPDPEPGAKRVRITVEMAEAEWNDALGVSHNSPEYQIPYVIVAAPNVPATSASAATKPSTSKKTKRKRDNTSTSASGTAVANDSKMKWNYEKRYVLHLLFDHALSSRERQDIFNYIYQAELAALGFTNPFPYSRMRQQNGEKDRADKKPPLDWRKIVIDEAADDEEDALRDVTRDKVEQAAQDLGISLDG